MDPLLTESDVEVASTGLSEVLVSLEVMKSVSTSTEMAKENHAVPTLEWSSKIR
jgi:hypothetical protein